MPKIRNYEGVNEVSVILVHYRTEPLLLATLKHISELPGEVPNQIIVVNNSPTVNLKNRITSMYPQVEYMESPKNLGFGGGVNLGLTRAKEEIVILLNPDARPEPDCLKGLAMVLSRQRGAAVAGPKLLPFTSNEPLLPSATRRDPNSLTALIEYTPFRRFFKRHWLRQHYFIDPFATHHMTICAMVQGACFAFKKSWIERIGPFDSERFFLYFEETDFCRRVRAKGGHILYCPQFICRHSGGASFKGHGQDAGCFWESFYAFYAKHYGAQRSIFLKFMLTLGLTVEYFLCKTKQSLLGNDPGLGAYVDLVEERLAIHLGAYNE